MCVHALVEIECPGAIFRVFSIVNNLFHLIVPQCRLVLLCVQSKQVHRRAHSGTFERQSERKAIA